MYLFLHGLIGSPDHWTRVVQALPKSERCVLDHFTDYSQHDVVEVAAHYRAMLGAAQARGERTIVVGNSLGCVAALHLQGVVDGLVLTAPPFDFGQGNIPLQKSKCEPFVRALFSRNATIENEDKLVKKACDTIDALMADRNGLRRIRSLKQQAKSFTSKDLLGHAGAKASVVIGDEDFTTPRSAFSKFMSTNAPQAHLRVLKNCGHAVPLEQPRQLAWILEEVLAQSGSRKIMDAVS